ncbi:hypothetical protein SPI_01153 [Niveomyces insectorum RCEF 264]|uniref:Uncharacterized protein n=1 Tax=Niveomyces insectorum RCEF 264 TaxID=1081102 RepID=A0A167YQK2_9HYPO|nr:hypothetical protein SPI_01153 [Niveomyces insectorum RCEF 264]
MKRLKRAERRERRDSASEGRKEEDDDLGGALLSPARSALSSARAFASESGPVGPLAAGASAPVFAASPGGELLEAGGGGGGA